MTKKELKTSFRLQTERLLAITGESIETLEKHTKEMQKNDPFVIAPPEEILRICNCLQKINEMIDAIVEREETL